MNIATPLSNAPTFEELGRHHAMSGALSRSAILVVDGMVGKIVAAVHVAQVAQIPRCFAPHIGPVKTVYGGGVNAAASLENEPGFLFDALVLPEGAGGVKTLANDAHTQDYSKDQYHHGKAILALGASETLLQPAGVPPQPNSGGKDKGLITSAIVTAASLHAFITAIAQHRHPEREAGA